MRFETMVERYHDEIYSYIWRMLESAGRTDSRTAAEDLVQESFLRAYRAYGRLRANSNHRAWLYKIATNCTYTGLRQGQRQAHDVEFEDEIHETAFEPVESPQQQILLQEAFDDVEQIVLCLPHKQRSALILRHLQGFEYSEIATVLECTEDSARANVYQAIKRLREELSE